MIGHIGGKWCNILSNLKLSFALCSKFFNCKKSFSVLWLFWQPNHLNSFSVTWLLFIKYWPREMWEIKVFFIKQRPITFFKIYFVPVQLTLVMIGGLGLSVSVVTWVMSVITPSLLGVNPSNDSEYWVAGSSNRNIIRTSHTSTTRDIRIEYLDNVLSLTFLSKI